MAKPCRWWAGSAPVGPVLTFLFVMALAVGFAQTGAGVSILDASDTADLHFAVPVDGRTQKPVVAKPPIDPEVVRRMLEPFFRVFFKHAIKLQKPTSAVAPPAEAPGTEVQQPTGFAGAVGKVGRAVASAAATAAQHATQAR